MNDPLSVGNILFSLVPASNSLVPVSDPRKAFGADAELFKGPRLTSCVASGAKEKQGHRQVDCEVPGSGQNSSTVFRTDGFLAVSMGFLVSIEVYILQPAVRGVSVPAVLW